MDEPLISVIITTHEGRRERCRKALASVINQTYKSLEIIVVDDASHDGTDKMVKSFKDKRIIYIKRKTCFQNDTRPKNDGIRAAHGEYVAFLDSDNEYKGDAIRIRYQEFKKHPELDLVYTDRLMIDEEGGLDTQVGANSDFDITLLFKRNYIDTSEVLIKRSSLFFVGGFDERYEKYIDWNLWIRMAKAGMKFGHIPKVTMIYHLHKGMKSLRIKDDYVGKLPIGLNTPEPVFRPKWDARELEIQLQYLGDIPDPKVAVFTLTMNRLELTMKMFESLKKAGYPFDWFVVDQGSTDGTYEWLKERTASGKVKLLSNKVNTGISHGSNQALQMIGDKYDFIIKIDNDIIIHSDNWLIEMLKMFQKNYTMALSPDVEGLIENAGGAPRMGYGTLAGHTIGVTHHIGGIFTMCHKSAYASWRWNEGDFKHSFQDLMFTTHLKEIGYICAYVEDMRAEHQLGSDGQRTKYPEYFKQRLQDRTQIYEKRSV